MNDDATVRGSRSFLRYGVALALIVASGFAHGLGTGRWKLSAARVDATKRLAHLPMSLGDWDGQPRTISDVELAEAGADSGLSRRYVNRTTGATVSILFLCGRPGPISAHTPEVCYGASGYEPLTPARRHALKRSSEQASADFWVAEFTKRGQADAGSMRVFWSWTTGSRWLAPDSPRFAFATVPALVKLYAVHETAAPGEPLSDDPTLDLLGLVLSQFDRPAQIPSESAL